MKDCKLTKCSIAVVQVWKAVVWRPQTLPCPASGAAKRLICSMIVTHIPVHLHLQWKRWKWNTVYFIFRLYKTSGLLRSAFGAQENQRHEIMEGMYFLILPTAYHYFTMSKNQNNLVWELNRHILYAYGALTVVFVCVVWVVLMLWTTLQLTPDTWGTELLNSNKASIIANLLAVLHRFCAKMVVPMP